MTTLQKLRHKKAAGNREFYETYGGRKGPSESDQKWALLEMNFGAERRQKLKEWFKTNTLTVNRKWGVQLKHDPDLRIMLKQGTLRRTREGSFGTNYTVLSLV